MCLGPSTNNSSKRYYYQEANALGAYDTFPGMNEVELAAHRIQRLMKAVDRVSNGNKTDFGRKLGFKDGAFVRQMLAGTRPITEKTVRTIESLHGMKGWFKDLSTAPENQQIVANYADLPWPLQKATIDRFYALTPEQRKEADIAFDTILRGYEAGREKK